MSDDGSTQAEVGGEWRWRDLAEQLQLAVVALDLDGHLTYANPWFLGLSGYAAAEIVGSDFFDRFLPDTVRDAARKSLGELTTDSRRYEASPLVTRVGERRMVAWFTTPQHDVDGNPTGILGVGDDVTEREEAAARLSAINEITRALLDDRDADAILRLICRQARLLVGADLATIAAPIDENTLMIRVADGAHATEVEGMTFSPEQSVSGAVISSGKPLLMEDAALDPRIHQPIVAIGEIGPSLFVPLVARGLPFGTILAARLRDRPRFTEREMHLLDTFAAQAAVTFEYSRAQQERRRLALLEDRERIARDLHDKIIQQLFATGMALEAALRLAQPGAVADRIQRAVDDLDSAIRDIRTTIFALESARRDSTGLRSRVLDLSIEAARALGFEPRIRFGGTVDAAVDEAVADHLLAILREALSNVARHAGASSVDVAFDVSSDGLVCRVIDNGVGLPESMAPEGLGLRNMGERARILGGSLELFGTPGGGTRLELRVPYNRLAGFPDASGIDDPEGA